MTPKHPDITFENQVNLLWGGLMKCPAKDNSDINPPGDVTKVSYAMNAFYPPYLYGSQSVKWDSLRSWSKGAMLPGTPNFKPISDTVLAMDSNTGNWFI